MNSVNASVIAEMGIMDTLATVFSESFPTELEPAVAEQEFDVSKPNDVQCGIISSPIARRLFVANVTLGRHIEALCKEHEELHDLERVHSAKDCITHRKRVMRLVERKNVLKALAWQAVAEEYPVTAANQSIGIRRGWLLIKGDANWVDLNLFGDHKVLANNFVPELVAVFNGTNTVTLNDVQLEPVNKDEVVLGTIKDDRIKAVSTFHDKVKDLINNELPANILEQGEKALRKLPNAEADRARRYIIHIHQLTDIVSGIYWGGIIDAIPEAADKALAIREDWQVVALPVQKTETTISLVLTPRGPAISVTGDIGSLVQMM